MHDPPRILIVDDSETNRDIVAARLGTLGYELLQAADGEAALAAVREHRPDLVLMDVMMPVLDGIEACRRLKADPSLAFTPVVLLTAKADTRDVVAGFEAGADEYLTKPVDQPALVARVRSMLRIKALQDRTQAQADELAGWGRTLEDRVDRQLAEIRRVEYLKNFLPPQIAQLIAEGNLDALDSHRREIVVAIGDLRGFTAFAETGEPEDVMDLLRDYHSSIVPIIFEHGATLDRFMGDGVLCYFNDPLPCADPAIRAVRMADAMRRAVSDLSGHWRRRGHAIGFGMGIAQGYATMGRIGWQGRLEYSAIGSVINLAARLCGRAADGQIVVTQRVAQEIETEATIEPLGSLALKGFSHRVPAFNLVRIGPPASAVAAGGGDLGGCGTSFRAALSQKD